MNAKRVFLTAIILLCFSGLGMGPRRDVITVPGERLIWPPPPFLPKIEFIKNITKPEDIGVKKGFFKKIWEAVAGEAQEDQITRPFGIIIDEENRLYITDSMSLSLHIFDLAKGRYDTIEGTKTEHLKSPISVATDKDGGIYISDSEKRRIYAYSKEGKYLREIGTDEMLQRPTGIAVDKTAGILYVADTLSNKICAYTTDGQFKFSFGERGTADGQFNYPTFITISRNGELYVADTLNFRIQIFDKKGKFISKFGRLGNGTGDFSNPRGIAIDSDGNIYVVDRLFESIQIFDKNGQLMLVFGKPGRKNGEFSIPAGITIDKNDNIYIADSYNNRVQVFKYIKNGEIP